MNSKLLRPMFIATILPVAYVISSLLFNTIPCYSKIVVPGAQFQEAMCKLSDLTTTQLGIGYTLRSEAVLILAVLFVIGLAISIGISFFGKKK